MCSTGCAVPGCMCGSVPVVGAVLPSQIQSICDLLSCTPTMAGDSCASSLLQRCRILVALDSLTLLCIKESLLMYQPVDPLGCRGWLFVVRVVDTTMVCFTRQWCALPASFRLLQLLLLLCFTPGFLSGRGGSCRLSISLSTSQRAVVR